MQDNKKLINLVQKRVNGDTYSYINIKMPKIDKNIDKAEEK
jgi:hypothetical protein